MSSAGPPYIPIKVIPPYSDPTAKPTPPTPHVSGKTGGKTAPSNGTAAAPSSIPQGHTPNINSSGNDVQYPSLPNIGNYQPPTPGQQPAGEDLTFGEPQNYPQPTYPGQSQYQQRGEVYPHHQANEHSRLLNQ